MSTLEVQLARHDERIGGLEARERETSRKLDWLIRLLITTLIATSGGLVIQVLKLK